MKKNNTLGKCYTADFETTTNPDDCRVWAWAICNIYDIEEIYYGNDIVSFINKIQELANCNIYFHNLRFDSQFIIYYLLRTGFKYLNREDEMRSLAFTTMINDANQIYEMDIIFKVYPRKNRLCYKKVKIFDSLKKLPFTVKKIAKDFELPVQKLKMDYMAEREKGHIFTKEEKEYLKNDVVIMAMALKIQFDQELTKMTIGADALYSYKQILGEDNFKRYFPTIDFDLDKEIRKAYHGGWTYAAPKFQCKNVKDGKVYDVNSLYPWAMKFNTYPVGLPSYNKGKYIYNGNKPLYIQRLACEFKLKKGYLPCIQIKHSIRYSNTEYLTESDGLTELTLCDVDLKLFFDHYDVYNIEYICYWSFSARDNLFTDYIDTWYKVKENSKGAIRQLAKLMLNNLYGKFATSTNIIEKKPVLEDEHIKYEIDLSYQKAGIYIPVGIWCTAYARNKTIRTAQKLYDRFAYADTDSVHLVGKETPLEIKDEIDDKKLGYWANESNFVRARFLKAKTYIEEESITKDVYEKNLKSDEKDNLIYKRDNKYYHLNVKCAGMPDNVKQNVTWNNFKVGFTSPGKLIPKNVKGGVVLEDTDFTIKNFELNKIVI